MTPLCTVGGRGGGCLSSNTCVSAFTAGRRYHLQLRLLWQVVQFFGGNIFLVREALGELGVAAQLVWENNVETNVLRRGRGSQEGAVRLRRR